MFDNPCPRCHAEEEVVGNQTDHGIRLTCKQCGHSWLRAGPRCRTCGGEACVVRPQKLVVNPRGNQLATVGVVETRPCPICDAEILTSTHNAQWLPDGYVSCFVNGPRPPTAPTAHFTVRRDERGVSPQVSPRRPTTTSRPPAAPPSSTPVPLTNPTVRQAIDATLKDHPELNAGVITLFALHLCPATGIAALGDTLSPSGIRGWLDGVRLPASADATLSVLTAHWASRGWLG